MIRSLRLFLLIGLIPCGGRSAGAYFEAWPEGTSPEVVGRRVAERFLAGDIHLFKASQKVHYAETCTWYGALNFARLTHDRAMTERLVARFEPLFGERAQQVPEPVNVDFAVFGALPLELFIETRDRRYLTLGLGLADRQWASPADTGALEPEAREAVAEGLSWHTRFWVDDMYMITMLQTQAYRATGDRKYLDRAAHEARVYLEKLQQPNGLFYHAPDVPFFWGRGNGWFAAGMTELLRSLPEDHPDRPAILAGYRRMMAALLRYQAADGMWRQLIDDPESWDESSGTGMFTYAFVSGVKNGWLEGETYGPAARSGWLALVGHIDADAAVHDVCEGTNKKNDRQHYLDRLRLTGDAHGQAPVLWSACALLR